MITYKLSNRNISRYPEEIQSINIHIYRFSNVYKISWYSLPHEYTLN